MEDTTNVSGYSMKCSVDTRVSLGLSCKDA